LKEDEISSQAFASLAEALARQIAIRNANFERTQPTEITTR